MGVLQVIFSVTHLTPEAARSLDLFGTNKTDNMNNTMSIFSDDFSGIRVRFGNWVVQIGAILSDHIAMHQLLVAFSILTMGFCMVHALRSVALASSPVLVTIIVFAAMIVLDSIIRTAIVSSDALASESL